MTETPRTNAEVAKTSLPWNAESKWVLADFAAILEHELTAMTKARDNLEDIIRREAWLGHASAEGVPGPYVPWDAYAAVTAERDELLVWKTNLALERDRSFAAHNADALKFQKQLDAANVALAAVREELRTMTENRDAAVSNFAAERAAHDRTLAERDALDARQGRMEAAHDDTRRALIGQIGKLTAERDAAIAEQNRLNDYYADEAINLRKMTAERDALKNDQCGVVSEASRQVAASDVLYRKVCAERDAEVARLKDELNLVQQRDDQFVKARIQDIAEIAEATKMMEQASTERDALRAELERHKENMQAIKAVHELNHKLTTELAAAKAANHNSTRCGACEAWIGKLVTMTDHRNRLRTEVRRLNKTLRSMWEGVRFSHKVQREMRLKAPAPGLIEPKCTCAESSSFGHESDCPWPAWAAAEEYRKNKKS